MSNQIRPLNRVFALTDPVVLEISVESAVETFTWVILDADNEPVALRSMTRLSKDGKTVDPGQEFAVTVAGSDQWPDEGEPSAILAEEIGEGDFRLRLYAEEPRTTTRKTITKAALAKFVSSADLLDEDAFSVTWQDVVEGAAPEATDIGEPLRVALVREGPSGSEAREAPVTYEGFRKFLEDNWGRNQRFDEANSWPAFGNAPYLAVRDAARTYVADVARVRAYSDLLPGRYRARKLDEAEDNFPGLTLPRNAAIEYLPGVELIWNYWLEEGMLVQTLNVILARFQNRILPGRNPLARFDVTPLLPLRNKLWGFAEDEMHRMTVRRRAVEYEYEYGFPLIGRAIPRPQTVVERRTGFIETFHQVIFLAHRYFKELDDLTVQADPFPLYRALRDCHIVLSQGTQNQYGEMAVAARAEFLVMQSILAEPQMREFLGGRPMTPYPEPWMDRVDSMKSIQGWADTSIMHFNDLATIGEQLVLTIRLGDWAGSGVNGPAAASWAQALRNGIQQYAAAYRSATGVDLSREASTELPSTLLARRLAGNRVRA